MENPRDRRRSCIPRRDHEIRHGLPTAKVDARHWLEAGLSADQIVEILRFAMRRLADRGEVRKDPHIKELRRGGTFGGPKEFRGVTRRGSPTFLISNPGAGRQPVADSLTPEKG